MNKLLKRFFIDCLDLLYTPPCESSIRRMAFVFALFGILGASIGIPFSGDSAYYTMLIVCSIYLIYKGGFKISAPFIAFYAVILINVLILDIPPFFRPFERAGLFILLTIVCCSSLETPAAVKFRAYLFRYLIYGIIIIGVGSFFCFFLGINMMKSRWMDLNDYASYANVGGRFSGLASHSMMLGPIAMISALTFYFLYQKRSDKLYLLFFFFSAMSAVLASSRAAILSLVVAIIYNLIMGKVNAIVRKRMIRILAFAVLLTIPISGVVFKGVMAKQAAREKVGTTVLDSRQDKFTYRINEFKSSPLFGVGFCAIDINGGDTYGEREGRIEPGSSHLSVLSMTGLAGFIVYLIILYKVYANTRNRNSLHSGYVFACFIAMFIHAWFEGYILSGGGFLALLYWLIVGQCIDCAAIPRIAHRKYGQQVNILHC